MSGFVALLHGDGRPVDDALAARLTAAMAYRGPDGRATWSHHGVAFGHAAFHTLQDPAEAPQPVHLGERLQLVGDARVDDREGLRARLAATGRHDLDAAPDALLLAHAYDAFGEGMIDGLLGDFAFVVWDAARRRLFAARDQMGVKPLYYAVLGADLLIGNTLAALRAHPGVSDRLDEHAVADYLLFGLNRHAERTTFAAIRRLPPAHTLVWTPGGTARCARYWRLAADQPLALRGAACVERFDEVFGRAVADRVRGPRAAVLMSGGLDSTSVAAVAHELMQRRYADPELVACTFIDRQGGADPESGPARAVAAALGISHRLVAVNGDDAADLWGPGAAWSAEPNELPASARMVSLISSTLPGVRVAFTGQGGDPALHVTPSDAAHCAGRDGWGRTAMRMLAHRVRHGALPRVGLRTHLRRTLRGGRGRHDAPFPPWLRSDLIERLELRRRHRELHDRRLDTTALRPEAAFQLDGPEWSFVLEWYDPGMTGFAAEYRHPLLDVRVLELALRLPMIPWLAEKQILRRAMRGRLPAQVLSRRKTPLAGFPVHRALTGRALDHDRRDRATDSGLARDVEGLAEFIDIDRLAPLLQRPERLRASEAELVTRPLGLAMWLRRLPSGIPGETEVPGEANQRRDPPATVP
jgi:asparagine synthase (glutamine-hydrolysing)